MVGDISNDKVYVYEYDAVNNFTHNQTIIYTGCTSIEGVSITNDHQCLAVGCNNGSIKVYTRNDSDFSEKQLILKRNNLEWVTISHDHELLIVGSEGATFVDIYKYDGADFIHNQTI